MAQGSAAATIAEKVENIPLSEIDADLKWNSRFAVKSSEGTPDEEDHGGTSYVKTKASIAAKGQDDAVVVRPHPDPKSRKPFALVAGFRRYAIISELAEERKDKHPTIKAVVRKLSEREARSLNMRENTARDSLNAPDLAHGINDLVQAAKENGEELKQGVIGTELGISQGYVAKLLAINTGAKGKLLKLWRESPTEVSVAKMGSIVKLETGDEQEKEFRKVGGGSTSSVGRSAFKKNQPVQAENIGKRFGILVRRGLVTVVDEKALFSADEGGGLHVFMKFNGKSTENDLGKAEDAAIKAFRTARDTEEAEEEEDEEGEEVSAAGKGKAKGKGKKGNAAQASAN